MQTIAKKYGVELGEIYFIDDQLSYLMGTDALGVHVVKIQNIPLFLGGRSLFFAFRLLK
jgi:FMN phosphatase YigB (HAD superfamily)